MDLNLTLTMRQILSLFLLLSSSVLFSQPFTEANPAPSFLEAEEPALAFNDVDGDGDLDVFIIGGFDNQAISDSAILYTNDGQGTFTQVKNTPFEGLFECSLDFVDVNGDGRDDLITTGVNKNAEYKTNLYINDGTGNFNLALNTPFTNLGDGAIAHADVDGDNDQDIMIAGTTGSHPDSTERTNLYLNDGNGNFTLATNNSFNAVVDCGIAFGHANNDTHIDVVITGLTAFTDSTSGPTTDLYLNDGSGSFTLDTAVFLVDLSDSSVDFADIDGDNDEDLLLTGSDANLDTPFYLYLNDGNGEFTATDSLGISDFGVSEGSADFVDINLDGAPDIFVTGSDNNFEYISVLLLNDGTGTFTKVSNQPFVGVFTGNAAFGDVDGDTIPDILLSGYAEGATFDQPFTGLYINELVLTSLDERVEEATSATLFPNPAQDDQIYLQFHGEINFPINILIYNTEGRIVLEQQIEFPQRYSILTIDVSNLSQGTYNVCIENKETKIGQVKLIRP